MRVLLLAETCNPSWPSLPSVGYNACVALAERVDAVLATHVRNRPAIEARGAGRARVVYIDNEYVARNLYRLTTFLRRGHSVAWTTNTGTLTSCSSGRRVPCASARTTRTRTTTGRSSRSSST